MNSDTLHFSDKAIKIIQFNLLHISCKNSHIRRARVTLFFRRTDQFRINDVCLFKQLQLNQCNLCLEKLYTGRQEDLTFQVILHFHLATHQIFVKSLPRPLAPYHSCLWEQTLCNHFPTVSFPICLKSVRNQGCFLQEEDFLLQAAPPKFCSTIRIHRECKRPSPLPR